MIKYLEKESLDDLVKEGIVLVDFYADWCGPCKMLSPIIDSLASSRNNIKVAKVNVDELSSIARNYSVMSIPTLILFKNGSVVDKKVGFVPEVLLNEWINEKE